MADEDDAIAALQRATLATIDAVRSLLDAVEEVVSDRDRLDSLAADVGTWIERVGSQLADVGTREGGPHRHPSTEPDADGPRLRSVPLDPDD